MPERNPEQPGNRRVYQLPEAVKARQAKHRQQAEQLLAAYRKGDPQAIAEFRNRHPDAGQPGFTPSLLAARMLVAGNGTRIKRLSLEKLKKEAKELLKQLKSGTPDALERLKQHHRKHPDEAKLADAQHIIARENGLPSWPKLKAHIESFNRVSQQLGRPENRPDAHMKTLHIRCGNDIQATLKTCGFTGDFLEVSNPFPQGPVPHFKPLEPFIRARTQFVAESYGNDIPPRDIEASFRQEEHTLRHLAENYERVVLWYEHDPFDQLSKAYVLAHLAELDLENRVVECIQVARFPGVKTFIGIGQLCQTPEAILTLWAERKPVTPAMIAFGARCWKAFTADNPTTLQQITRESDAPLPLMQAALKRMLMELPWTGNGLSLTEQLALTVLAKEGPMRPGAIFNLLMNELEPLPFLGDIMLLSALRPLWQSAQPTITVLETFQDINPMRQSLLEITDLGKALLNGKTNGLTGNEITPVTERNVGGIRIVAGKKNWYWSGEQNKPIKQ